MILKGVLLQEEQHITHLCLWCLPVAVQEVFTLGQLERLNKKGKGFSVRRRKNTQMSRSTLTLHIQAVVLCDLQLQIIKMGNFEFLKREIIDLYY
ncbi:hypothetical protein TNCV_5008631 [Trichonephila clavipes]|nr:hypothetical protein TNCV_5008631 [Trichonephila clavipes]